MCTAKDRDTLHKVPSMQLPRRPETKANVQLVCAAFLIQSFVIKLSLYLSLIPFAIDLLFKHLSFLSVSLSQSLRLHLGRFRCMHVLFTNTICECNAMAIKKTWKDLQFNTQQPDKKLLNAFNLYRTILDPTNFNISTNNMI